MTVTTGGAAGASGEDVPFVPGPGLLEGPGGETGSHHSVCFRATREVVARDIETEPPSSRRPGFQGGLCDETYDAAVTLLDRARRDVEALSDIEGMREVGAFERAFARYSGAAHALAVSSGTAAMIVALRACGVGPGDEVVTAAYGWGQTVGAILDVGAVPVFADVDPLTFNLDPDSAAAAVTSRTRAVLVTHLFGAPADMPALESLCRERGLVLIADSAQADGALLHGRPLGAYGDATAHSLGRGKSLTAGEGGVVTFRDEHLYERTVVLSQHPVRARREVLAPHLREHIDGLAVTARLSPLLAVIAHAQLPLHEQRVLRRRRTALALIEALSPLPGFSLPVEPPGSRHAFHTFALTYHPEQLPLLTRRQAVARLQDAGLPAASGPVFIPLDERVARLTARWRGQPCPTTHRRCAEQEVVVELPESRCGALALGRAVRTSTDGQEVRGS